MPAKVDLRQFEEAYKGGKELNLAPFDEAVSFVFRNLPDKPKQWTRIMEVGCGAGNNLFFFAQQQFQVAGIDSAAAAIDFAGKRFGYAGLNGDIRHGSFVNLPWPGDSFDLAIDRAALSYATPDDCAAAIDEIHRVLLPGGKFLFTPYATLIDGNSSYTYAEAVKLFDKTKWQVLGAERVEVLASSDRGWQKRDSHYRITARKISSWDKA